MEPFTYNTLRVALAADVRLGADCLVALNFGEQALVLIGDEAGHAIVVVLVGTQLG